MQPKTVPSLKMQREKEGKNGRNIKKITKRYGR